MDFLESFCRQIRLRSSDNRKAFQLLGAGDIPSQMVAVLRQELDSMIRAIYLLSQSDMTYRDELIQASVEGKQWIAKGKKHRITDKEMVEIANELHGWTESVYRFGCAFIHLSSFHDYRERDPMDMISKEEKESVLKHMRYYHGGPSQANPTFKDLIPYLPMVFEKIASNLECYVKDLETKKVIE
jgi:hypothetical protein